MLYSDVHEHSINTWLTIWKTSNTLNDPSSLSQNTQHLPYDTGPEPVVPPVGAAHEPRPFFKSQLPPQLQVDPSIPRLEPWVGLFGQWLPEQVVSGPAEGSNRTLALPENPHLLFWDILYDMYATVDNYLRQPASGGAGLATLTERLAVNGAPIALTLVSSFSSSSPEVP